MQIAAAEWRATEELKIEAEVEHLTQDRIKEQLNIQQLQLLSVHPSRVGKPNVVQYVQMESTALNEMSLDYVNRTRK